MLQWPRIKSQRATVGDLLEVVRNNDKSRCELGELDGVRCIRTLTHGPRNMSGGSQGHTVDDINPALPIIRKKP